MARHVKNHKRNRHGTAFWDKEYTNAEHLALSTEASEDLEKFTRWLERQSKRTILNATSSAIDLGCGNGRNLVYLANAFGCAELATTLLTQRSKRLNVYQKASTFRTQYAQWQDR
jgi:cyclopropane fatty-acyl-phospholipid synthase-like methyltransferase